MNTHSSFLGYAYVWLRTYVFLVLHSRAKLTIQNEIFNKAPTSHMLVMRKIPNNTYFKTDQINYINQYLGGFKCHEKGYLFHENAQYCSMETYIKKETLISRIMRSSFRNGRTPQKQGSSTSRSRSWPIYEVTLISLFSPQPPTVYNVEVKSD